MASMGGGLAFFLKFSSNFFLHRAKPTSMGRNITPCVSGLSSFQPAIFMGAGGAVVGATGALDLPTIGLAFARLLDQGGKRTSPKGPQSESVPPPKTPQDKGGFVIWWRTSRLSSMGRTLWRFEQTFAQTQAEKDCPKEIKKQWKRLHELMNRAVIRCPSAVTAELITIMTESRRLMEACSRLTEFATVSDFWKFSQTIKEALNQWNDLTWLDNVETRGVILASFQEAATCLESGGKSNTEQPLRQATDSINQRLRPSSVAPGRTTPPRPKHSW